MVYTATSRALAALEFFVNLQPIEAPDHLLMAEATVPDTCVEVVGLDVLPRNWRALNNQRCRDLGSEWAASCGRWRSRFRRLWWTGTGTCC